MAEQKERWSGDADLEKEGPGGGGKKFPAAPRGFYRIQVADYTPGTTKSESKRDKVDLLCEIATEGSEFGKRVYHTITKIPKGEPGHGMMIHALHAFGIDIGETFDFALSDLQGAQADTLLDIEEYESKQKKGDGTPYINEKNVVEAFYTEKHPQPDTLPDAKVKAEAKPKPKPTPAPAKTAEQMNLEEVPF